MENKQKVPNHQPDHEMDILTGYIQSPGWITQGFVDS